MVKYGLSCEEKVEATYYSKFSDNCTGELRCNYCGDECDNESLNHYIEEKGKHIIAWPTSGKDDCYKDTKKEIYLS